MCTSTSTQRRTAQRLLVLEDLKLRSAAQHKQLLELKYKCKLKHNYTKRNRWINILGCSSLRTKLEKNKKDVEQHWFVTFSQLHQHLYTDHCDWQINYLYFRPFKIIWFVTYIKKLPGLMRDYKRPQHTNWQCYCHNPCLISLHLIMIVFFRLVSAGLSQPLIAFLTPPGENLWPLWRT